MIPRDTIVNEKAFDASIHYVVIQFLVKQVILYYINSNLRFIYLHILLLRNFVSTHLLPNNRVRNVQTVISMFKYFILLHNKDK